MNNVTVAQSNSWCFTLNNYTTVDVDKLCGLENDCEVAHLVFGREVGESGTPHLQGFIRFHKRKRARTVKKLVGETAHIEVTRNPAAAIEYCKKDGNFTEIGGWESQQGQRSDLNEIITLVREGNVDLSWWILNHPDKWSVKAQFIRDCITHVRVTQPVEAFPLRKWQAELWRWLMFKPDNRHILFVVDYLGGFGKSYFCNYYFDKYPDSTQIFSAAKSGDLAHAYKVTNRVLFFDVPRSRCDQRFFPYGFLEGVKNGQLFSSKYDSVSKRFTPPHVVVFMNEMPDMKALSHDRYCIRVLNRTDNVVAGPLVEMPFINSCHTINNLPRDDIRPRHGLVDDLQDEQHGILEALSSLGRGSDVVDTVGTADVVVDNRFIDVDEGVARRAFPGDNEEDDESSEGSDELVITGVPVGFKC